MGGVAERLKVPHLKCGMRETVSWVRIPPPPPSPRRSPPGRRRASARLRRVEDRQNSAKLRPIIMSQTLNLREHSEPTQPEKDQMGFSGTIDPTDHPVNKRLIFYIAGAFVIIGLLYIFWGEDFIAAALFILVAGILEIQANRPGQAIVWEIGALGINYGQRHYAYYELTSFWLEFQPEKIKELSFQTKKWYYPYIKIPLTDEAVMDLRGFLITFLPEEKHEDSIADSLSRILGI